jgi:hypothetical protein
MVWLEKIPLLTTKLPVAPCDKALWGTTEVQAVHEQEMAPKKFALGLMRKTVLWQLWVLIQGKNL